MTKLPVAIIGGGPVGLAAAAHLLERGERPVLFEAGSAVGASVLDWGHVQLFSPWEFNVDEASMRLLEQSGWEMPPAAELPTGAELYERYLRPLAELPAMRAVINTATRVAGVSRRRLDKVKDQTREQAPFQLHIVSADGVESLVEARAVIDASGAWRQLNPMGANGLPAIGETALRHRIAYGLPDVKGRGCGRYADKRVLVVGSGHSAINVLLDLIDLRVDYPATEIVWAMRGDNLQKVYGGGEADALEARGQLGMRIKAAVAAGGLQIVAPFAITEVAAMDAGLCVRGEADGEMAGFYADELISTRRWKPLAVWRRLSTPICIAAARCGHMAKLSCGSLKKTSTSSA